MVEDLFQAEAQGARPPRGRGGDPPKTPHDVVLLFIVVRRRLSYSVLECVLTLSEALAFPMPLEPQASRGGGLIFLKGCRVGAQGPRIFHSPPGDPGERETN